MKKTEKRITEKRINVRAEINSLRVRQMLALPKNDYRISTVRSTAATITGDTGKRYTVTTSAGQIMIKRIA